MSRAIALWIILIQACVWVPAGRAQSPDRDIRLKHGDDPRWAAPDWDDSDWTPIKYTEYPARAGIYWVRIRLVRPDHSTAPEWVDRYEYLWPSGTKQAPIDGLFFSTVYSFELFLDGQRIATDGVVGHDRASEVPGKLDHLVRLPEGAARRPVHVLALRMSTYHYNFPATQMSIGFQPVNFAQRLREEALQPVFPLIGAVGSLLMTATSLVLFWFIERRRALWLVSVVSLVLAVFYGLIAVRWVLPYTYDWHYPRLLAITWVLTCASVLLIWLLLEQFAVPRKLLWLALSAPLLVLAWQASPIYELKVLWICRAMLVVLLAVTGWACWQHRPGAWLALAGVAVGLLVVQTDRRVFLDPTFFLMIEGIVLLVFAALGAQVQAERTRAREAQLTTARLETELLKKNLQPHFLLNTLTAVAEVIEQDPQGAVGFIEDLGAEFRLLAQMSGERLVPLERELELCRLHLKVIGRRTGREIGLVTEDVNGSLPVPPALFLTLIENGLVHQRWAAGSAFRLRSRPEEKGVSHVFFSPGTARDENTRRGGGTGLRYVKARLEESFPGRWTFTHGAVAGGWETIISWQTDPVSGGVP
ncbi:hypothetical protein ESB00_18885 [Oleiharenicola lentus]|uniref:Signal transduction histidine kinase internal region domain-containing protein n=1 Tax=Oleiharenicola lentus TaxID=2508720 RepID=A0A4Q1C5X5_9BACT|nr:histidine kinase [Oleiharenicola lentus]RXK53753.1 hypothetical protein ESB00_18885 [Oleiharenicola lentus]